MLFFIQIEAWENKEISMSTFKFFNLFIPPFSFFIIQNQFLTIYMRDV